MLNFENLKKNNVHSPYDKNSTFYVKLAKMKNYQAKNKHFISYIYFLVKKYNI